MAQYSRYIYAATLLLALQGCGENAQTSAAERSLSELSINSAKRQCVSVAVLQQVPQEAASGICDCTVDRLVEVGQMTASLVPSDSEQQLALDACIDAQLKDAPESSTPDTSDHG